MNRKIGVLTHYYNSVNYGGNLQAYALVQSIYKLGYTAEQISYLWGIDRINNNFHLVENSATKKIDKVLNVFFHPNKIKNRVLRQINKRELSELKKRRDNNFQHFNKEMIYHSKKVYTSENISETLAEYDIFITGSDQVWNTEWYTPVFFLDFVPSDKIKFSYAASISKDKLTDAEKELFKKSLADYKAVSVREENAVEMLRDLSPVEVELVLDPTLLLSREDWDKVCDERVIQEDYIFCYFLGENKAERKLAQAFAKRQGIKIVSIPLTGAKIYSDLKFGDFVLPAASPEQFISLIKYAKYVFTDSFHAVVFSYLYEKQFFVFNRDAKGTMNSRIKSITKLLHMEDRFCGSRQRETIEYISALQDIDYKIENPDFKALKDKSIAFLKRNLTE